MSQLTNTDRILLAAVSRWAHTNGWTASQRGWVNARYEDEATITVGHDVDCLCVWRKPKDRPYFLIGSDDYPVTSVVQGVDVLCALGILPPVFSSAYKLATALRDAQRESSQGLTYEAMATGIQEYRRLLAEVQGTAIRDFNRLLAAANGEVTA